jgi:hypothetical protein
MTNNSSNKPNGISEKLENITFTQLGFKSAEKAQSQPSTIDGYLDNAYDKFLKELELDEAGKKERINALKEKIKCEKISKEEANAEIDTLKQRVEKCDKKITEKEREKIDIQNGDGTMENGDTTAFVIGAFITLLLTMYLFVFYSSSGYSAFYGIKQGSLGFINPNVFSDAINKGGGVIALIILFPVIFLAMGFYIHVAIENNKKLKAQKLPGKYGVIVGLLTITLIADMFIGYKISQGVHTNSFNAGLTNETWKFNMIFTDINFYLVLVLGFVVYVVWGFLLNFVLSHPYLRTESEKLKLEIKELNRQIDNIEKEKGEFNNRIERAQSDIRTNAHNIDGFQNAIDDIVNGKTQINIDSLKGAIGEFMGGWQNYTNGSLNTDTAKSLNDEATIAQNQWLNLKLQKLTNKTE